MRTKTSIKERIEWLEEQDHGSFREYLVKDAKIRTLYWVIEE